MNNIKIKWNPWLHLLGILLLFSMSSQAQEKETFDINELPFSRFGSYTAFSVAYDSASQNYDLFLRDVSGKYAWANDEIFKIEAVANGQVIPIKSFVAHPWILKAKSKDKNLFNVTYDGTRIVRIQGEKGLALRLSKVRKDERGWEWHIPINENQYRIHGGFDKYVLTGYAGKVEVLIGERIRNRPDIEKLPIPTQFEIQPENNNLQCEFSLERYYGGWKKADHNATFDELTAENKSHFKDFLNKYPGLPEKYDHSKFIAAYVNWSCVVEPRGILKRNGMLMSKALMRHIWSWDHCFNALALSYDNPEIAWDQLMVIFDAQQESGAVVDYLNDHHTQIAFVKPPVHGLILKRMMERNSYFNGKLDEIYEPLTKWTNFWFDYLDDDGDGLPQYNHGCNSGWDNNTVWDMGFAVEGPDLSAFLVLQMDVLADVATKLGKPEEAKSWKKRADTLLAKMMEELWNGENFVYARNGDGAFNDKNNSLIKFLPMILGDRLPKNIQKKLVTDLKSSGLITAYGPATEHPESPFYDRDGYWRGPIWAPSTYLIAEGVKACGDDEFATSIAQKFCDLCDKAGFRENFVATTGEGLRDIGYTWTSSVFLVMGHDYLNKGKSGNEGK